MTSQHPDLAEEQAYIDHAYRCLEWSKADAWKLRNLSEPGLGGTFQARYERDVFDEALVKRLTELDLGRAALVFGRIDRHAEGPDAVESFHIGRLAVSDEHRDPVVVDWRAPVAEPFYRATGREPMGLVRRRHFSVKGSQLLGIEDELFGAGHLGVGDDGTLTVRDGLRGYSTLLAALDRGRTGQLGDIVATIQAEQDEIIRSPHAGVLVVEGGPGTGKTVVALHRAAYLLYTYRFPLEDQGVLVIGPNRVFLRYIDEVLPSLGEAGVDQVTLADLVPEVTFGRPERAETAALKGRVVMAEVIAKAVRDRQRPLRQDLVVPFRSGYLRLRAAESQRIVQAARRRYRRHNAARKFVETEVWAALAATARDEVTSKEVREQVRHLDEVRAALERMWPVLTPAELLHDLFGSLPLVRLAASRWLSEDECALLHRPRSLSVGEATWSAADIALLDEARELLGPRPRHGKIDDREEIRTYGHIVIDEVQDLTPMELRMAARRSLNGSMTVVGDLAQATGPLAPGSWEQVLAHLPDRRPPRVAQLSIGYRIPGRIMRFAARVLPQALPGSRAPDAVREGDHEPTVAAAPPGDLARVVAEQVRAAQVAVGEGNVAVVAARSLLEHVEAGLDTAGVRHARATRAGLGEGVNVVPITVVKGLELDAVVVVEPAAILGEEHQGAQALYTALTRATRYLAVVHARPLPAALAR
jgi:DNA helicase IV